MAYVECKVWPFQDDDDYSQRSRHKAMKAGHRHYAVKALIDTTSHENKISKSLADKLGEKYGYQKNKKVKNSLGTIYCLDLSFRYKGADRLVSKSDSDLNDFEVIKKPCKSASGKADLILGIPWLWLREAKIDMEKRGLAIYGDFVSFCKGPDNEDSFYNSSSESESESDSDSNRVSLFKDSTNSSDSDMNMSNAKHLPAKKRIFVK